MRWRKYGDRNVPRKAPWGMQDFTLSGDAYLLFKLIPLKPGEPLFGIKCDISKLPQYSGRRAATHPFTVTFEDVLLHAVCG